MNYPLLDIQNLSIEFRADEEITSAVKNVSFTIQKRKITAVVGESGSGKTVTSLSILQLLPSSAVITGSILFHGKRDVQKDLLKSSGDEMRKIRGNQISMIFQEPMNSLNPVLTCGRQVMESILLHNEKNKKIAKEKTINLFKKVDLPDPENIFKKFPHELSGGQKQRVMIAMAVSCNPALLIADEPTTALDVTVQKTILNLLGDLQQDYDMGVIYISHDLNLVAEIADDVVVMYKGAVIETGTTENIFTNPSHPYTKALLACRPSANAKGLRLPQVSDFMNALNAEPKQIPSPVFTVDLHTKILQVQNLSVLFPIRKTFFGKPAAFIKAVDDISFDIYSGETIGIVGESGSGKTTLGRTLMRLIHPDSGKIIYKGRELSKIPENEVRQLRKNIQIIFQDPYGSLNPRITIGNAISEPIKIHGLAPDSKKRKEKVYELLEKVDLKPEHFNRYPHQFSGGQRQRISIARALGLNPDLIICDESVSALDVSVQAQVLNLLNDLKKQLNFTCIFISHDLQVVKYMSDRILVMNKGRIEESGTSEEIYFHPEKEYTKKLISAIPKGFKA
ncbi:ABC transporter ATP-binding protein [soil metagenome]